MRLSERIERRAPRAVERLDAVAVPLQDRTRALLERPAGGRLWNLLHGTWLGHPLHPPATDLPMGCLAAAAILDAAGGREAEGPARLLAGVGVASALGAAASGAAQWSGAGFAGRRTGLVHAAVNVFGTLLAAASLSARGTSGRRLRLAGLAAMGVGGYLGGRLVFDEGLGVDHADRSAGPEEFTPVMARADLAPDTPTRVDLEGQTVVLVARGETIHAIGDLCSHYGGPLSEGTLEGDTIVCPWHGSAFCLSDGRVRHGPATARQPAFTARVHDGQVELRAFGAGVKPVV